MMDEKIVLYGGTYLNKGGAAIAYGTLKALREIDINFQHIIDPEPFFPFDSLNLNAIYRFSDVLSVKPIDSITPISTFNPFIRCLLKSYSHEINQLNGYHIWHIGDSPFSDSRSALSVAGQVMALESLRRAVKSDVIIGGVSIDYPKTRVSKYIMEKYFANYNFYARGNQTFKNLLDLSVPKNNIVTICDFAFHLNRTNNERIRQLINTRIKSEKPIVALCLRDYSHGDERQRNIECIKKMILLLKKEYDVFLIPTSYAYLKPENDYIFIKNILRVSDDDIIIIRDMTPGEIIYLLSHFDIVISSRLHGAVLGALANVPTIHLYEGGKSLEVLGEVFGKFLPLIPISDFIKDGGVAELVTLVSTMIEINTDLSSQLDTCIKIAKANSAVRLRETINDFL